MPEPQRRFHRLKAYWALRGATDPGFAASMHTDTYIQLDAKEEAEWEAECLANGWIKGKTKHIRNLHDLEKEFLPIPTPNINLIIKRCPQMGMIHALRGDVCEPYWWAVLSITEHATPNLSRECSDGYPGFSEEELCERITRIHNEKKKPALCTRLNEVNQNVCIVCKFQGVVRTPIALGFEHEPKFKIG